MKTVIITDSCCDLSNEHLENKDIEVLSLMYNFGGMEYKDEQNSKLDIKEFYDGLRKGVNSKTSQVPQYDFEETFTKYINEGKSIIYIGFSKELSGTYNSACMAKESIYDKYKDADIDVIDSKSGSIGQGILVYEAYEMLSKGHTKEDVVSWIENNKMQISHILTVDDINHLKRGGRISSTNAAVANILGIKPIIAINEEGQLVPIDKIRGRKKAINFMFDKLKDEVKDNKKYIGISHADCEDEAKKLAEMIKASINPENIIINNIGPVLGSHVGPGTLGVYYFGNSRNL